MTPDELENKINELSNQVTELSNEVETLRSEPTKLDRNLDDQSKIMIEQTVSDAILDIVWDDYFYYSSVFESIDRYLNLNAGAGSFTVGFDGVTFTVGAPADEASTTLTLVDGVEIMKFDKETRFRVSLEIDDVSNCTFDVDSLKLVGGGYIGFSIAGGTITGESNDGSTTATVAMGSVTDGEQVILEFRYEPNYKVRFFTNGIEQGSIDSNFPVEISANRQLILGSLITSETAAHNAIIHYFDFIQKK